MSRAVVIGSLAISLAWAIGFGAYAMHVRSEQAQAIGMYVEDRCLNQAMREGHGGFACEDAREEAEAQSNSGFPVGNVAMVIGIPIALLWGIVWFVARRKRKGAPSGAG